MLPHDVVCYPETETGSLLSCRKERFKDSREIIFTDANATVAYLYQYRRLHCLLKPLGGNTNLSVTNDCLLCVDEQVEKHLAQLICTRANTGQLMFKSALDSYLRLFQFLFEQHERFFQQLIDVNPINLARASGEPEHLPDDVRNPFRFFPGDLEKTSILIVGFWLHQVERILYRLQRVVNLMRNRGCQTADGGQLFRFKQLLLDAPPL